MTFTSAIFVSLLALLFIYALNKKLDEDYGDDIWEDIDNFFDVRFVILSLKLVVNVIIYRFNNNQFLRVKKFPGLSFNKLKV